MTGAFEGECYRFLGEVDPFVMGFGLFEADCRDFGRSTWGWLGVRPIPDGALRIPF